VFHGTSYSQYVNRAVEFEDLGFTFPLNVGARPAGLAGAYVAAGNDVNSLIYNPAGLAGIKRIELSLSLQQERKEIENTLSGNTKSINTRDGGIDGFGIAWPFPVYQGSLVAGFGVYRVFTGVLDLHYSGEYQDTDTIDNFLLQQTGSAYSYNVGFGVDLSPSLSGGLSVFLLDGTFGSLRQLDFTFTDVTPTTSIFVKEDMTSDLTGIGGRIGVQFFIHPTVSGGVNFTIPTWFRLKGTGVAEITEHRDNAPDEFTKEPVSVDNRYLLPFRIDLGVALTPKRWLLAFELGYSDWTEASIDRKRFRDSHTLETTFQEVFDYKFAAEYTMSAIPLRLRAGYAYRPYPLARLQADRINENAITKADVDGERSLIAFGVGGLVGDMLTLDASLSITNGKRSTENLSDERTNLRFVLSAAYRF
jgi:long-subunit fatty acid transport protein